MTRARLDGFFLFLLGSAMFVWLGFAAERASPVSMADFKGLYYGARCLLQHSDPYRESELLRIYQSEGGDRPSDSTGHRQVVTLCVNPPTAFILTVPFALLAWGPAHLLWTILTAAGFIVAAFLTWSLGADHAPVATGALVCIFLFNSELLLEIGNASGLAISLCVIAVWCFVQERSAPAGILCFALSLTVKPHIAALVWLYFLLSGGLYRKRALQTLAVTVVLALPAILGVWHIAPHWIAELQTNLQTTSAHGNLNDPGPATVDPRIHGALIIDLQSAISILRDDPRIYNPATYLICAPLLLIWAVAALRKRPPQKNTWLALAAIAALSMLPVYHRTHDTRLLLLTLPAFAILWAKGGLNKWLALVFTGAGAAFIGVTPERLLDIYSIHLRQSTPGLPGLLLTLVLTRPVPLILLIMGTFYLWVYVRHNPAVKASAGPEGSVQEPRAPVLLKFHKPESAFPGRRSLL